MAFKRILICWLSWRTVMVSPSWTPTTLAVIVCAKQGNTSSQTIAARG